MTDPEAEPFRAAFTCGHCGAGLAFAGVRSTTCPYCASPNVVERPPSAHQPRPALVIAFELSAAQARARLERWLGSRSWFADGRLSHARISDLRGVYVPAYLYSAVAHTDYNASIGEHYDEEVMREVDDGKGGTRREPHRVTRVEYRPLAGRHVDYVTDVLVSASHGLGHDELNAVAPFEMQQLRRYAPALVSGWVAEEFARAPDDCLRASRREAIDDVGLALRGFLPGDSHNDLRWRTTVQWESLDPILVPVFVFAVSYAEDRPLLRVVINGQTGRIAGRAPLVAWKIVVAVIALAVIAIAVVRAVRGEPAP